MTAPSVPPVDPDLDRPADLNVTQERDHAPLGLAVIGCGYWGPNLVRNFAEIPGARVVAVSDLQTARLAPISARYPSVRTTTDHRELLRDPAVEAIAIATPVSTHYELARQALEAGKHVFVEKPMATS